MIWTTINRFLLLSGLVVATMFSNCELNADEGAPPVRDFQKRFQAHVRNWKAVRNQNIVMQRRDYSCGAAALATILTYYWGDDISEWIILRIIEENLDPAELAERIENGLSITDLRLAAVKLKYLATIGRLDIDGLYGVKVPVIVAIELDGQDHFVVVRGIADGWIYLADPIRGNIRMPVGHFADIWIENALLVVAKPGQAQSTVSQLELGAADVDRGWLNNQVIRTFPEKVFRFTR